MCPPRHLFDANRLSNTDIAFTRLAISCTRRCPQSCRNNNSLYDALYIVDNGVNPVESRGVTSRRSFLQVGPFLLTNINWINIEIRSRIVICIHVNFGVIITFACPTFSGGLVKPQLKLRHVCIITYNATMDVITHADTMICSKSSEPALEGLTWPLL